MSTSLNRESYGASHCWQYDIRLKNLEEDLRNANLTREDASVLRVSDFEFSFVPKTEKGKCRDIVSFIERHEWLGKMPKRPTHRFIATYKGRLAGVIVMATPNSFSNLLGEEDRNLEKLISRGACISWSPKNLGSALIMYAVRWMVKHTGFRVFTAYSDIEARELGTIYQACNFHYLGQNSGGRFEYFDPDFPNSGWFSDRQFRQLSQIKRYARDLGIGWQQEWSDGRVVDWRKVPADVESLVRAQANQHRSRCKKREVQPKHKYVYILGATKTETKSLLAKFRERHPDLQDIPYPKHRGPVLDAAANTVTRPCQPLPENFESSRPDEELSEVKDDFLTVKEAAQMMRVSDWTIYNMIKSDPKFPALNIGVKKKFVVDRVRLADWLKNRSNERSA